MATMFLPIGWDDLVCPSVAVVATATDGALGELVLQSIVSLVVQLVAMDNCIAEWRHIGFARIFLRIDLSQ